MLKEARKETVHIDISVTSRNVDRKIMQPISTTRDLQQFCQLYCKFIRLIGLVSVDMKCGREPTITNEF